MGVHIFDRAGGMFMPGPGDVGIHIILGEANLSADFIGMDLAFADQIVNGGLADMEDVSHFLGGQRFVLGQTDPSSQLFFIVSQSHYTLSKIFSQDLLRPLVQIISYFFILFRTAGPISQNPVRTT